MSFEKVLGNIMIRPNNLKKKGDKTPGHTHCFHHTTVVSRGGIKINKKRKAFKESGEPWLDEDGIQIWHLVATKEFLVGQYTLVLAEEMHDIEALEDDTEYLCVYSHRTPQGVITQECTGWEPAYASGEPMEESPLGPGVVVSYEELALSASTC